ncbi:hypothetical protein AAC691_21845 [Nguyenibacter vanlangensis]|uniref:Core-binding (CB) domain-containing protein n=1 Tax=Nguyenibacter vanlangensis TaxID=1216886 RepID=A0ABZ3D504_9PROT
MGITKRGEGQWFVRIRRRGFIHTETCDSYEHAETRHAEVLADITANRYRDIRRERETTQGDVLGKYLKDVTPTKKGAKQEGNRIKAWMDEDISNLPFISITPRHIADRRNRRIKEGKAPTTVNNSLNLLSAVFKMAATEWGHNVTNLAPA